MGSNLNETKYKNVILYICERLGGSVSGKKKLYKLLYYIDFDNFEYKESMRSITGEEYQAWKMGPVPQNFAEIMNGMIEAGEMAHSVRPFGVAGYSPMDVYVAYRKADRTVFTDDEKFIIDRVIDKYGQLNGKELETLTHAEAPYIATEPNDNIAYELAFYRGTDFYDSVAATS